MAETRVDQLSDFTHFLEFHDDGPNVPSSNSSRTLFSKPSLSPNNLQTSSTLPPQAPELSNEANPAFQEVLNTYNLEQPPFSKEELMKHVEKIAEEEGVSTQKVMEDMTKRNSATNTYRNFLLTDMMVKGSFLIFNFWMLMLETQKKLIKDDKPED